ncbi:hypothetical protein FOXG_20693 [Fusarium oxysporum f. sp. lycopersici 4287]|uniref:Uncharacterized protein n=1 Tax=Fusarium oxysporum f. sp. lycopersici (strain 4287 / CBS 123668 / FGSC 9935 / NRRL 34936) TaxID=426428 RepID=A0A0J9VPV9_FUSO4|nr:hypothetical protein FOXG_20693 [Fusarium oxysporum f. sp. lycopersici 4287]KNB12675.1 hypothetical protein FOXG_20693 [Fusarium oxysporum f. sp. lycopersici 4287]
MYSLKESYKELWRLRGRTESQGLTQTMIRIFKAFIKYTNHSLDMGILLVDLSDLQIKIPDRDYKRQASALRK